MAYFQCMNIGSEGASVLEDLTDISLNNLTNGQILKYNTTTQKWENSNESGEIPDVQLFETLTYTEVKASSVVSPFTIANNTLTSVSSSMSDSETNILSTDTFDLTDINIIEVVVDSATFYQGGNWNGFFYVCDNDTNIRNNTYPSVAHKIMFSNTSTPLKYSLDVSQLNGQWFIGVCTGGHTNLVVSAVAIGSGLTGHVIIDKNNVDMSQRSGLQFTGNVTVTDDSTNDKTVINIQGTSIDDTTASADTTYSSSKLESDFISVSDTEEQTATDEFTTINGGLLSSLKVSLSPNQDLHGYDHPWVGGAGKNLYQMRTTSITQNGITVTANADGTLDISGTATATTQIILCDNLAELATKLNNGGTFTLSLHNATYNSNTFNVSITYVQGGTTKWITPNSPVTVASGNYTVNSILYIESGVTVSTVQNFAFQLEEGSTATTYEPYENICPISGHTEVKVGDEGKNKLTNNLVDGTVDGIAYTKQSDDGIKINGTATGRAVREIAKKAFANGSYIISKGSSNALFGITVEAYNDNTWVKVLAQSFSNDNVPFTVDNDGYNQIRVTISTESGRTANDIVFYPMIRFATETDPTFVPYNGYRITVNLGGTYYSGILDVVTGVFTPDMAEKDVSASDLINQYLDTTNNQYLAGINANAKIPSSIYILGNVKCNELTPKSQNSLFNEVGGAICIMNGGTLRVTFSGVTTFADMQTWVTNHPLQVVYELATPTPIQLSPTMVKALVGENHLSAPLDGQEITESVYSPLAKWNAVIDDTTASNDTTYSSNKTDTLLNGKVDKVNGKGLSTNDYTDAEKTKLEGITAGAEVNTIASISVNGTTVTPDANRNVNIVTGGSGGDPDALTAEQVTALIALLG